MTHKNDPYNLEDASLGAFMQNLAGCRPRRICNDLWGFFRPCGCVSVNELIQYWI